MKIELREDAFTITALRPGNYNVWYAGLHICKINYSKTVNKWWLYYEKCI